MDTSVAQHDAAAVAAAVARLPRMPDGTLLPPPAIKLVLFDMDQTILRCHTRGCYRGNVADLCPKVSMDFVHLVPGLLDAGYHVGIVTFSDALMALSTDDPTVSVKAGEPLVHELLELTFAKHAEAAMPVLEAQARAKHLVSRIHVAAAFPQLQNQQVAFANKPMPRSKQWHIEKIKAKLFSFGVSVANQDILLFDDTVPNVRQAEQMRVHAFVVDKSTAFTADIWNSAMAVVASRLLSSS